MKWLREEPQIIISTNGIIKWNGSYKILNVSSENLVCEVGNYTLNLHAEAIQIKQLDHQFLLLTVEELKSIQLKETRLNE